MSDTFKFIADGETRLVPRTLRKGQHRAYRDGRWGTVILEQDHLVDDKQRWNNGDWVDVETVWYTLRPAPPVPGFWRFDFWVKLFRRNKIPTAKLVKG